MSDSSCKPRENFFGLKVRLAAENFCETVDSSRKPRENFFGLKVRLAAEKFF
ncbi:MAG: hypothetical protein IJR52_03695 [Selenomonadaceae bacterium]|nr:hypothetical protein [Selenomonadaceae bacterium]